MKSSVAACICLCAALPALAQQDGAGDAAQANNPLANFTAVNLQNYFIGEFTSPDKSGNQFWVRYAKPISLGEAARSTPLLRKAQRLNPGGGYLYFLLLGRAYLFQGDLEQALINLREAARRNPADLETHVFLAASLVAAGDPPAAELEADEVRIGERGFSMRAWLETYPLASSAYRQRLLQLTAAVLP